MKSYFDRSQEQFMIKNSCKMTIPQIRKALLLMNPRQNNIDITELIYEFLKQNNLTYKKSFTKEDFRLKNNLTEMELNVLKLVADGCTDTQIAKYYTIELTTVRTHLANLYLKVCVPPPKRVNLALYYIRNIKESEE